MRMGRACMVKSLKHYLPVIAISLLPFIAYFLTPLAPHTHDSPVHYARIAAYYKALSAGQILPRWAGELNYGYGMPLFNFIYHVPYLVTSLILFLGAGLVTAFKLALTLSFVLSGVFSYMFGLRFFGSRTRAYVFFLLYQFAPFHLIDLAVRGDIAEGYALAFLPLVLFAIVRGFDRPGKTFPVIGTAAASAFLIISHNAISLVFFGIAFLFSAVFAPDMRRRLSSVSGLMTGLLLSAFYWVPALLERKYTYGDLFMKDMYKDHFAPLVNFFIPNVTNDARLLTGGIGVFFGLLQTAALLAAVWYLMRKRVPKSDIRTVTFGLFLTAAAVFIMQPVSRFVWSAIPILRMFQFPWRLLNVTVFSLALLGAALPLAKRLSRFAAAAVFLLTVVPVLVYFRPPLGFDRINEAYYWDYPLNTTYFGETDVIWSAGPAGSYPDKRIEIIDGTATVTDVSVGHSVHTFTVESSGSARIVDRTQYFPGWRVYNGTAKVPVEFQDQNWRGLITFELPPGKHRIRVAWEASKVRRVAESVTVLALIGVAAVIGIPSLRKRYL